jgi:threonine dehydratase
VFPATYYQHVVITPLTRFNGQHNTWQDIWLKDETQQTTHAFKFRGNFLRLQSMPTGSAVVTASTGNHGLGLATSAKILGLRAHVFLPATTARVKRLHIVETGAQIHEIDSDYDACVEQAVRFARAEGAVYIPSFDDPEIIRGHMSLFREIDQQFRGHFAAIFVPVGGGGLLAACIQHYAGSGLRIVGVELDTAPAMYLSLRSGTRVLLEHATGRAEGLLVRKIGTIPFELAMQTGQLEIALVTEASIRRAIRLLWHHNGIRAEGAGAAAFAAALEQQAAGDERRCACIISGGNIDDAYMEEVLGEGGEL